MTPIDLRFLDPEKDIFRRRQENEPILGSKKPYLSALGTLMYLANHTRPNIAFAVSLLSRHSAKPTIRHWNDIKQIFRYLQGSIDMGLFYPKDSPDTLIGYTDAGYLSDPKDSKAQTRYVFLQGKTAILESTKQTMTTTLSNHSKVIALYEACREALWLRSIINHIRSSTGQPEIAKPTTIYEDNKACIDQIHNGIIKTERTKHIDPKFFFTQEQQGTNINVEWTQPQDNGADIFTKPLPTRTRRERVAGIGMTKL